MSRNLRRSLGRALLACSVPVLLIGCGRRLVRELVPPAEIRTLDERSPFLKAHLADGSVYELSEWRVDSTRAEITGSGRLLDADRRVVRSGDVRFPADSVVLFETNVTERSGAAVAITVMAGVTAAVAGFCAISPKTCFGSCPTFYAPGPDGEMVLQAEGFSSSIAPALEASDVDMLLHTRPTGRAYTLRVTNEALETHVIRHADLLAVRRPEDARVYMTSDGTFIAASEATRPTRCSAPDGDCLSSVLEADGLERASAADSANLAARETIELEFTDVPDGALGLVLVSRQTLMTTFLVYQALAYMGTDAGRWLALLETGGSEARELADGIGRELGDIEVLRPVAGGEWTLVGSVGEAGPIASDTRVVPLDRAAGSPLRLRLRLTRGLWRLDQVSLVTLRGAVTPERVPPARVTRAGTRDDAALDALTDPERTLVTMPGDAYEIHYELPEDPAFHELFLDARGYYLEWMRQEWIAEENPLLAESMMLDPAGSLRALAPAFKEYEPTADSLFWSSRYGTR